MGMPQRVWSTFARLDFILVPLPAARTTAKIGELSDIYPHHSYRSCRLWRLGRQDSNLRSRDQNPVPCLLATPQYNPRRLYRSAFSSSGSAYSPSTCERGSGDGEGRVIPTPKSPGRLIGAEFPRLYPRERRTRRPGGHPVSPFEKRRNLPYRSLLAALVILAVTLVAGPTAMAQAPQDPSPAKAASEPDQPLGGEPARDVPLDGRADLT